MLAVVGRGVLLALVLAGPVAAASLDAALLPTIQGATFEVVAAKPQNEVLVYEKPLPLDLMDYQERTDKYHSIGTAFAIGNNRYVTAGHVMLAGLDSLWGEPSLRDAKGNVYAISKIEKFDLRRDFVVFSLAKDPAPTPLTVETHPVLNQEIYAVGNALGTGVVIRDGLYTSDTPEQQQGEWKWMRFSAAASPGNSGGPLLDKQGKVIGVVLMKSANENLNYALQMKDVLDAPANLANIDSRVSYQLDIFDTTLSNTFKGKFALPLGLTEFFASFEKLQNAYIEAQLKEILAKDADTLFPKGEGSSKLLYGNSWMNSLPAMVVRGSTGDWSLAEQEGRRLSLPANGYVDAGMVQRKFVMHLRRPDNVPADKLYSDPVALGDLLCKVGMFQRPIGAEKIRITSLGKPLSETVHVDKWGRRWQVITWGLPFANTKVLVYALPVPDGYAMTLRFVPAGATYDATADMRALTDFMTVGYEGNLAQWKDFLKNTAVLPEAFKKLTLETDYQKRFRYTSPRFSLEFTPELLKIEPDSVLKLGAGFLPDHGSVAWDINGLYYKANRSDPDRLQVERNGRPPENMEEGFQTYWDKLVKRRHPYEGVAFIDDGDTNIAVPVVDGDASKAQVIYTAFYAMGGTQAQDSAKPKLELLLKGFKVNEH